MGHSPAAASERPSPAALYVASLNSPVSRANVSGALRTVARAIAGPRADPLRLPWHEMRVEHAIALKAKLVQRYAPRSVNALLGAVRRTCAQAAEMDLMTERELAVISRALKAVPQDGKLAGRMLEATEVAKLFAAARDLPHPKKDRDLATLAIALCGLRRAELAGLDLGSHNAEAAALEVMGKGRKRRTVPLPIGGRRYLDAWIAARGDWAGPLVTPISRTGRVLRRRLSGDAVRGICQRLAKAAGVDAFSPHDMRRTFASTLLDQGVDLKTVSDLMGHADVNTTARYDRRGEERKRAAVELLTVPTEPKP